MENIHKRSWDAFALFASVVTVVGGIYMNVPIELKICLYFFASGCFLYAIFHWVSNLHPWLSKLRKANNLFFLICFIYFASWVITWFFVKNSVSYEKAENTYASIQFFGDQRQPLLIKKSNVYEYSLYGNVSVTPTPLAMVINDVLLIIVFDKPVDFGQVLISSIDFKVPLYELKVWNERYVEIVFHHSPPPGVLNVSFMSPVGK